MIPLQALLEQILVGHRHLALAGAERVPQDPHGLLAGHQAADGVELRGVVGALEVEVDAEVAQPLALAFLVLGCEVGVLDAGQDGARDRVLAGSPLQAGERRCADRRRECGERPEIGSRPAGTEKGAGANAGPIAAAGAGGAGSSPAQPFPIHARAKPPAAPRVVTALHPARHR